VALPSEILRNDHISWPKASHRPIANPKLDLAREDEHVLAAGGIMPIEAQANGVSGESEPGGLVHGGPLPTSITCQGEGKIFEMGLAVFTSIETYNHLLSSPLWCSQGSDIEAET
jgi:hypothetical protein